MQGESICRLCSEPFAGSGYGHGRYCSRRHYNTAFMREQRAADPEAARQRMRDFRSDPAHAQRQRESNRAAQSRKAVAAREAETPLVDPVKRRARYAVRRALETGSMTPEPCLFCGSDDVQGHHHDYALQLDVTWLCARHHALVHLSDTTAR